MPPPSPWKSNTIRNPETNGEVGSISTNGALDPSLRKKAVELTGTGLSKFPKRLDIGLGHAHVRFKTGDAKSVVATLRQLLKLAAEKAPDDTLVLNHLADAHRDRSKKAEAIAVNEKILKPDPEGEAGAAAREALGALQKDGGK